MLGSPLYAVLFESGEIRNTNDRGLSSEDCSGLDVPYQVQPYEAHIPNEITQRRARVGFMHVQGVEHFQVHLPDMKLAAIGD